MKKATKTQDRTKDIEQMIKVAAGAFKREANVAPLAEIEELLTDIVRQSIIAFAVDVVTKNMDVEALLQAHFEGENGSEANVHKMKPARLLTAVNGQ